MTRLVGKSAVITGAGSGIGRASALKFATEGAAVAVTDIVGDAAEAVAEEIRSAGGKAVAFTVDGTGLGPFLVGVLSDTYGGPNSLRWAILTGMSLNAVAVLCFLNAARTARRDSLLDG